MDLFTYLMAKNGNNTSVHGDLFSYLLGKGQSQTQTISGVTINIPDAKKLVSFMMTKESTQDGTPTPENPVEVKTVKGSVDVYVSNGETTNTYTINLGNNELVGIGTYKDELLVDKSGNVFINKKTGKVVFDGSENWFMHSYNTSRTVFTAPIDDIENYIDSNTIPNLLCSHFISVSENATWKVGDISRTRTFNIKSIYLVFNPNITLEQFKTWLSTHNTEVYYVLAQENLIDLQTTVDLSLFKGVNNVSNSENGYMTIEYR